VYSYTADDDSATAIIQAPFVPWFPRPTRKAPPPPSRRGFVLFLVLQVARDLHHLFEKQHPDSRVTLLHPKPVHHHYTLYTKYFSDVSCIVDINCGRCDENHRDGKRMRLLLLRWHAIRSVTNTISLRRLFQDLGQDTDSSIVQQFFFWIIPLKNMPVVNAKLRVHYDDGITNYYDTPEFCLLRLYAAYFFFLIFNSQFISYHWSLIDAYFWFNIPTSVRKTEERVF